MKTSTASSIAYTRVPLRAHRAAARRAPTTVDEPVSAGPLIKWVGGKTRLLRELIPRCPTNYNRYFEPFMGGAALFYALSPKRALLSDNNPDLVAMYQCVATKLDSVLTHLARLRDNHSSHQYYDTRSRWNQRPRKMSDVEQAATFIYLNKTCYNGLWRVNRKGEFNVPMGRYKAPKIFNEDQLGACVARLQCAEIAKQSYLACERIAEQGDFLYFDPPYHPLTTTASFTSYTADDFSEHDQRELARLVRSLGERGCYVMVSNSDTPFIREIYRGLHIEQVQVGRAINSRASARGAVNEVLIRTYTS